MPGTSTRAVRRLLTAPELRGVRLAVLAGGAIRLAWVLFATRDPVRLSDTWHYQQIASSFSYGSTMMIGDHATAFYPPGYPALLAPFAWLSRHSPLSLPLSASLLNVLAGMVIIAATAGLARQWCGRRAGVVAAWTMAVAPAQTFLTSVAFSETVFTAISTTVLVLAGRGARTSWRWWRWAVLGAVIGYATLIRTPGLLLLAAVPLTFRAVSGRWRPALRPLLVTGAAFLLALVPWTVRNGMQIGVWSPTSTNNVAFLCLGNNAQANGRTTGTVVEGELCFGGSVMDNPALYGAGEIPATHVFREVDEQAWYERTMRDTLTWIRANPSEQPRLASSRFAATFLTDRQALSDAEGFRQVRLVSDGTRTVLDLLANTWLWVVSVAGIAALVLRRAARAALPVWGLVVGHVLAILPGIGLERYHHATVPLLVVLGSALVHRPTADRMPHEQASDDSNVATAETEETGKSAS